MPDAPIPAEMPVKPTLAELAKPTTGNAASPTSPEAPATPPEKSPKPEDARKTLEAIAAGPKPEQTTELGPSKEKVDSILSQGSQLLLDAGDPRVAIAAVAKSAAPTPLGTELRRDVLTMIEEMNGGKLPAEEREALAKLQQEITAMNLPKTDPARSEFTKFLETYNKNNPDKSIPDSVIEGIRTKQIDSAQAITNTLKTDTGLSAKLWEEMKGDRTEPIPNVATPEGLLKAAGLDPTPENIQKTKKLFEPKGPHPIMGLLQEIKNDVPSMMMTSGMIILGLSQLIGQESSGGGH